MINLNEVIATNILSMLKQTNKKQSDLASKLNISKQTVSKMLNGDRSINAVELTQIADFFSVKMEELTRIPAEDTVTNHNVVRAFMGRLESPEARQALELADELADMIVFHARVRKNAEEMLSVEKG